jgi:PEP-CTERM motif
MRYLGAVVLLMTVLQAIVCHADSLPFGNNILTNGAGGVVSYNPDPELIGQGFNNGGQWLFEVTGAGRLANGYLVVTTAAYSIEGSLSRVYFNTRTGLLQAAFVGQLRWPGGVEHIYHAVFYESIDLTNKTTRGGFVVFSTAPEPSAFWLMGTGLVGIVGRRFYI